MPPLAPLRQARAGAVPLALALLCAGPAVAAGQEGCVFGPDGNDVFRQVMVPSGGTISYVSNPHFVCEDGVQIWADSAVGYSDLGMSHLMGSVRYLDRTRELRADTARYFQRQGRVQANGHVFVRDEADGSSIENGDLVLLRQTDFRDEESLTVTTGADGVRPVAFMMPQSPDSGAAPDPARDPYRVEGDRIVLLGSSYFSASGSVEIEQDSLLAFADSAEFDEVADRLLLERAARVLSRGSELVGRSISVGAPGSETSEIRAVRDAVLTGDGLLLTSAQILVFLADGDVERLVATAVVREQDAGEGGGDVEEADLEKPVATLDDAVLSGDSMDILAPGEAVERVIAVGGARSVSTARDSLTVETLPEVARSDWLEGDTVTVTFRPSEADSGAAATGDEPEYDIDEIVAAGAARALYRLAAADTSARAGVDPPALHYVVGERITIHMAEGDVDVLRVVGQTQGAHLEPLVRPVSADSLADTASVRADTLGVDARGSDGDGTRRTRGRVEPSGPRAADGAWRKEEPWRRE